jgi:dUTP pyrophosphatase
MLYFIPQMTSHARIMQIHKRIMQLKIYVENPSLKEIYVELAEKHNQKILNDPHFYDSGFDLPLVDRTRFEAHSTTKVNFGIKCSATLKEEDHISYSPFYLYARSSISKTPLRLANNQGIIDAGYRGNIIGMFDNISDPYSVEAGTRLIQICAPTLCPIFVTIVENLEDLGPQTSRGEGGFGSTSV